MGKYIQGEDGNWYEATNGELNWIDGTTEDPRALTRTVKTDVSYGQMPETKDQYILPVQLVEKNSIETTTTQPAIKSVVRSRKTSSTTTSTKPLIRKTVTPKQTNVNLQRTTKWQELPDGTKVNVSVGDWASIK